MDQLRLRLLMTPAQPLRVGELHLMRKPHSISPRFAASWLARGFALSKDLLLLTGEFFPREKDTPVGAVNDARPNRWGERVIRFIDKPPRLSLLEYLLFRR